MSELPTPAGLGDNVAKVPLEGGMKVAAVKFKELQFGKHSVEYGKKGDKYIFHFFKNGQYPMSFRSKLYTGFVGHLNLYGREEQLLEIDWIPEFSSWCVILPEVSAIAPPPSDEVILEMLKVILS